MYGINIFRKISTIEDIIKAKNTLRDILRPNQTEPGNKLKGKQLNKGNQPPKNNIETNALIKSMFAYSAKKNKAKVIAEYSTL